MKKINIKKETAIDLIKRNLLPFGEEADFKIAKKNAILEIEKQKALYDRFWSGVVIELDSLKLKDLK